MKLTPLDIRKQEFKKTMRGFDPDEVEAFLSMVADEMELLIRERNQTNDELIKLRTQLKDYQRVEHTLRETLVRAQSTVEESRANSRREAEIIIHEAELQADNILKEAREELMDLRHEISLVKTQKESFSRRLRHLLQSQIELLDVMEMDDYTLPKSENAPRREPRSRMARHQREQKYEQQHGGNEPEPRSEDEMNGRHEGRDMERSSGLNLAQDSRETKPELPPESRPDEREKEKGGRHISDQFII
ncbi:MAG: DivIVA domain-containing protein [Actinobacteria bacterium]|nr:DivIVA domain-containing protein [Actinomycetota bacterium]